jgi:hypothetical protein
MELVVIYASTNTIINLLVSSFHWLPTDHTRDKDTFLVSPSYTASNVTATTRASNHVTA